MSTGTQKPVQFGVRLPVVGPLASPKAIARVAREAEQLGYDVVWVNDFIAWTTYQNSTHVSSGSVEAVERAGPDAEPTYFESLTTLSFVAGVTDNVKLGIAVLCLPFRNPIIAAKQVANIDVLSGGRMILGIGVGAAKSTHNVDFEVLGVSRVDKYEKTKDYLRAMMEIWQSDKPVYDGPFISFPETEFAPKPTQKPYPPIWFGGGGAKSVELCAELGTGWLPPWVVPDEYPGRIAALSEAAARYGRADVAFDIGTEVYVCIALDSADARNSAAKTVGVLPEGFAADATAAAVEAAGLIGSPEEIGEKLSRYVDAGVRCYEMKFIYHDIEDYIRQMKMFAEKIIPAYR
jgi:alkanesulfonate monooxygenase SsuD/methylene tetrahydromethanopterin reductase-like flavin-dependent oxidoreductase (luciferase family)